MGEEGGTGARPKTLHFKVCGKSWQKLKGKGKAAMKAVLHGGKSEGFNIHNRSNSGGEWVSLSQDQIFPLKGENPRKDVYIKVRRGGGVGT